EGHRAGVLGDREPERLDGRVASYAALEQGVDSLARLEGVDLASGADGVGEDERRVADVCPGIQHPFAGAQQLPIEAILTALLGDGAVTQDGRVDALTQVGA